VRPIALGCHCDPMGAVDCTSCRACQVHCPSDLDLARVVATSRRLGGVPTSHQGVFTALSILEALGASASLGEWHATRPGVVTGDDAVFFPGTAALMDPYFGREAEYSAGPHGALLLLNAAGVRPRIVGGGSGHDLWYQGAFEEFQALSDRLVPLLREAVEATGGGPVVCHSAEDAHALRDLHGVDAVHISQYLAGRAQDSGPGGDGPEGERPRVAFLDPCRLGRFAGVYDEPRDLLSRVAEVADLGWDRGEEPCCGVSAWVNCNAWSKDHRRSILQRAVDAGVEVLVTGCPMCQVHMDCYYDEEGYDPGAEEAVPVIRIADLTELLAELTGLLPRDRERLEWPGVGADAGILMPVARRPDAHWLDDEAVRAAHLCTQCLRCVEECPQSAPVLDHVDRVRRALVAEGRSPPPIAGMVESIGTDGNPFGEPRERRTEAYPSSMRDRMVSEDGDPPDVLVFLGCVDCYQDPRVMSAIGRVLEEAGVDYAVLGEDEGCCGYVDHLAGAHEAFEEVARDRMGAIVATGARVLVTPCAGCFRTFSQLYGEVDPAWPGTLEVLHLIEYLDALIGEGRLPLSREGKVRIVAYHDACDLGRHCGVYDAPRRVLSTLPGVVLEEFPDHREKARCCGGGGALRAFDTDVSLDIASRRLEGLVEGVDAVVSGCPSCKGNLRLAATRRAREGGPRIRVVDVVEMVAAALDGGGKR
jgi:Fe-S oxidoreductase